MEATGPDCRRAYHALTAVLPALRDRLTVDEVAQTRCPVADPGSRALLRWKKLVQMQHHQPHPGNPHRDPEKLRALASWYREAAEQESNPMIWEGLLSKAEGLDKEAERISVRVHGSS